MSTGDYTGDTQVIIQNRALSLARYLGLSADTIKITRVVNLPLEF